VRVGLWEGTVEGRFRKLAVSGHGNRQHEDPPTEEDSIIS
jgi:hypothetical protein